jgi:hypothetical protein
MFFATLPSISAHSGEDHEGWLEVVGMRMEGSQYKLWRVIIERTENVKR